MAIITISQIKHRRGIKGSDPMPQLASAELGWAVDAQELYIGNGTLTEGAPAIGNTEILTEHSDLSALLSDYIYTGPFPGATMQTGVGAGSPIVRTNDDHDDDVVNVRDFGAEGDGVTDDTAAIQRALDQHFKNQPVNNRYWTTVYFPAGTYVTSARLQIPPHARLVGDGYLSSIIELIATSDNTVIEMERVAAVDPEDIYFAGLGFTAQNAASHVCTLANSSNITFDRCAFNGASTDTTLVGNSTACVLFETVDTPCTNIKFLNCYFNGATYGVASDTELAGSDRRQDITNVLIKGCLFDDLFKGIVLGHEADGTGTQWPSEWRIIANFFDNITRHGIHGYRAKKCTSSMNHFADVGNLQTATVTYPNITFGDTDGENPIDTLVDLTEYANNYSIGDHFDRTDADDATAKRVETFCNGSYIIDPYDIRYGSLHVEPGRLIELTDDTGAATSTGIALDSALYHGAIIDYQLTRGDNQRRTGTFTLVLGTTDQGMTEDYVETGPGANETGVVFTLSTGGGVGTIEYTLDDRANNGVLSYSIRHLTCLLAIPTAGV